MSAQICYNLSERRAVRRIEKVKAKSVPAPVRTSVVADWSAIVWLPFYMWTFGMGYLLGIARKR